MISKLHKYLGIVFLTVIVAACSTPEPKKSLPINPAAEGFNTTGSDPKAIAIADEVMEAMGGRAAWDATEELSWTFFGRRNLRWNKKNNTVRIEIFADSTIIELDMSDKSGDVVRKGITETNKDTIDHYLDQGEKIWINDSYWLVMPFKLKDSGVTLTIVGRDTTATGATADKLALTFENVGVTPNNKYEVLVTDENRLVEEWRFYTNATDSIPRFVTPWGDYKKFGNILLSGDRGRMALTDISAKSAMKVNE